MISDPLLVTDDPKSVVKETSLVVGVVGVWLGRRLVFVFIPDTKMHPMQQSRRLGDTQKQLCKTDGCGRLGLVPKIRDQRCAPVKLKQKELLPLLLEEEEDRGI